MNKCNGCTMCCYFDVIPELEKPPRKICQYQIPNIGCKIYSRKPQSCTNYRCLWYACNLPEEFKPSKTNVLFERSMSLRHCTIATDKKEYLYQEYPLLLMLLLIECDVPLYFLLPNDEHYRMPANEYAANKIRKAISKVYGGPIPQQKLDYVRQFSMEIETFFVFDD